MSTAADKMAEALDEFLRAYDRQQSERSMEAGAMAVMALASCRDALAEYEAEKVLPAQQDATRPTPAYERHLAAGKRTLRPDEPVPPTGPQTKWCEHCGGCYEWGGNGLWHHAGCCKNPEGQAVSLEPAQQAVGQPGAVGLSEREAFEAFVQRDLLEAPVHASGKDKQRRAWLARAAWGLANAYAEQTHAEAYYRQAEKLLTGNEATLHAEVERLRAILAAGRAGAQPAGLAEPEELTEPVNIAKAMRAHRKAHVVLNGGTGPLCFVGLVNIQLTGWNMHSIPEAKAYAEGFNTGARVMRESLTSAAQGKGGAE